MSGINDNDNHAAEATPNDLGITDTTPISQSAQVKPNNGQVTQIAQLVEKLTLTREYYFLDRPRIALRRVFENFYEEISEDRVIAQVAGAENNDFETAAKVVARLKQVCLITLDDIALNQTNIVFADGIRDTHTFSKPEGSDLIYINKLNARFVSQSSAEALVQQFFDLIFKTTRANEGFAAGLLEVLAQVFFSPVPLRYLLYAFGKGPGLMQLIDFISNAGGTYCEKHDISALQRVNYLPPQARLRLRDTRLFMAAYMPNSNLANSEILKRFIGERHHTSDLFQSRTEMKQRFTLLLHSNKQQQFFTADPEYWNHLLPFRIGDIKRLTPRQYAQRSLEIEDLYSLINNQEGYDALFLILRRLYMNQLDHGFQIRESVSKLARELAQIEAELDDFWIECTESDPSSEGKTRQFYEAYLPWCKRNNVRSPYSINLFSRESVDKDIVGKRKSNGTWLTGRRLKAEFDPEINVQVQKRIRARRGNQRRKSD